MERWCVLTGMVWAVTAGSLYSDDRIDSAVECRRTGAAIVEGAVGGKSRSAMIIDTGSPTCLVDRKWAEQELVGFATFQHKVKTISSTSMRTFFKDVPVSLSGKPVFPVECCAVDLSLVSSVVDRDVVVVGMPYLQNCVLEFSDSGGCQILSELPKLDADAVVVPMRIQRLRPEIEVALPVLGKQWVVLDTGNTGSMTLTAQRIGSLKRMGHLVDGKDVWAVDAQGELVKSNSYVLRRIRIAGIEFRNVQVDESHVDTIGLQLLHRFHMVLDFPAERIYLWHEGKKKVDSIAPNASGVAVGLKRKGHIQVFKIRENSPASELGLTPTDEITMIDGKKPASLGHWELQEILSQAGKTIPLTVLREGKELHMEMTLRHSIPFPPDWPPEKPEFNPEP